MSFFLKFLLGLCVAIIPCCFNLPSETKVSLGLLSSAIGAFLVVILPTKKKPKARTYIHYIYFKDGDMLRFESTNPLPMSAYLSNNSFAPHKDVYDTYTL